MIDFRKKRINTALYSLTEPEDKNIFWLQYDENDGVFYLKLYDELAGVWKNVSTHTKNEINPGAYNTEIHIGPEPPTDTEKLWLDTSNLTYKESVEDPTLLSIQRALKELEKKVQAVSLLRTNGIISGDIESSSLNEISEISDPIKPSILKDDDDNEETDYPDYASASDKTVNHISVKYGTYEQLKSNKRNLVNSELVWSTDRLKMYVYWNGSLYPLGNGSSTNDDNTDTDNMTGEELQALLQYNNTTKEGGIKSIDFKSITDDNKTYRVGINESGNLIVYDPNNDIVASTPTSQDLYKKLSGYEYSCLLINSVYLGGSANEHDYLPCSHNFVELSNISEKDISLNGLILMYNNGSSWKKLPLWGIIPAKSTFLIRGKQCSVLDVNTTKLKVKTFDMEWYDEDGELISFNQSSSAFYLTWADTNSKIYTLTANEVVNEPTILTDILNINRPLITKGYVDLLGIGNNSFYEKNRPKVATSLSNKNNILYVRWYSLDPVSQSNPKSIDKKNEVKYIKCIDLSGIITDNIEDFTPKASWEGKTHATDKHRFKENIPNCFTCNFGIQATSDIANNKYATRCFTWTSVGYFDEYIAYRKKDTTTWTFVESYKEGVTYTEDTTNHIVPECIYSGYSSYYTRLRWETYYGQAVTTHKVMISGLTTGVYEYCACRRNTDGTISDYSSKIKTFTVVDNSTITGKDKSFKFIQITDQQSANWEEMQVWAMSALFIKENEENYNFFLNTGDITYNGSRPCEWIDYFNAYEEYLSDKEENFAIGNNDLAPITMRELGMGEEFPDKINHIVADIFYTQEIDINNPPIFTGKKVLWNEDENGNEIYNATETNVTYKIPCLYSFNYGDYHFVSLNSEIRCGKEADTTNSGNTVTREFGVVDDYRVENGKTLPRASIVYDNVEAWLIKDLLLWKGITTINDTKLIDISTTDIMKQRSNDNILERCGKCIIYTHEMPFNITSGMAYSTYGGDNKGESCRETAKANLNLHHNFEFQRLFKIWGIRLVLGGHKHTCSITQPVYDADGDYNPVLDDNDTLMENMETISDTFNPIIQILSTNTKFINDFITNNEITVTYNNINYIFTTGDVYNNSSTTFSDYNFDDNKKLIRTNVNNSKKPICRMEIVDKITAPQYVMCQATGYKNKSNSDLCAYFNGNSYNNYWLKDCVPAIDDNPIEQAFPFYNVITLSDTSIDISMYNIAGLYDQSTKAGYWEINRDLVTKNITETTYKDIKIKELDNLTKNKRSNVTILL